MAEFGIFEQCIYGNGNRMGYSRLKYFEKNKSNCASVGIKYVIDGTEHYTVDQGCFKVTGGKFLLINPQQSHDVYLSAEKEITGICFNIDTAIINDVYHVSRASLAELLDEPEIIFSNQLEMHEQIYSTRDSDLGLQLSEIAGVFTGGQDDSIFNCEQVYFNLAENLLKQQCLIHNTFNRIHAERTSTKKELFKRIEKARDMLESDLFTNMNMTEVAAAVAMSPFHFNRTFGQIYQVTPYQYVINRRLEKAKALLQNGNLTVGDIAHRIGYADLFSFSKSFKKAYKVSPTAFKSAH
jgi:AraC family transcriptional regulator